MSASISFIKPIPTCSLYLVVLNDMIIGSIHMEDDMITNIDINGDFFVNIKARLIRSLLYELGLDHIDLICNPRFFDYYSELGFKLLNTGDKLVLRYVVSISGLNTPLSLTG